MKAKIIQLISDISSKETGRPFIEKIKQKLPEWNVSTSVKNPDFVLFAVITGGTENKFKEIYKKYSPPYFILFNEFNNSLPAATEILSFLNMQNLEGELIDINNLSAEYFKKRFPLSGKTLGVIGEPSDWLIASTYPDALYKERFNVKVKHIPIEEPIEIFKRIPDKEAEKLSRKLVKNANHIYGINLYEITKALKFYFALKTAIKKHDLDFITVRCFDIIKPLKTTGCLALSILNDEGVTAGCEADVPAALTMEIAREASSEIPFMANVSYIKKNRNKLLINFAHCTIATKFVKAFNLRTHFESGQGVGIEGKFEETPVTIVRIGGKEIKKAVVITGTSKKSRFSTHRCRSQLNVEVDAKYENYFLKFPLGNHHIIIKGSHKKEVEEYLSDMHIDTVSFDQNNKTGGSYA